MRRRRSPQEKKRLSLERDHPTLAKYPKAFRKNWKLKKRAAERERRAKERASLVRDPEDFQPARRRTTSKWRPAPLGEVIAKKRERRAVLEAQPRKPAAARERRRQRRHGEG